MFEQWIAINSIPSDGQMFTVDNPAVWSGPAATFHMDMRVLTALSCEVMLLPQEDGCLIRGRMTGEVALPCNRCTEDAVISLDGAFESFEPYPLAEEAPTPSGTHAKPVSEVFPNDADELVMRFVKDSPEINLAGLVWEEFLLCLPIKPLCQTDCKGLCPECGKNWNEGPCQCTVETIDPRLAALKNVHINKS